jgi:7-carboxy-7-deazaguanine synthase
VRVVEVFGPTVQGEGPYAGHVTHFVRFGGCDYRCSWCDSMYAVEPALVRAAEDLSADAICARLSALGPAPMLVLSGGNPALQPRAGALIAAVRERYGVIACETQGSVWRDWLRDVDSLVISPKPPSSGMATPQNWTQFDRFMAHACTHPGAVIKIVVFDEDDLMWAHGVHELMAHDMPLYLSAGTDPGDVEDDPLPGVAARYAWLCERVARDPLLHAARVLPQLHVIAWGHQVGV